MIFILFRQILQKKYETWFSQEGCLLVDFSFITSYCSHITFFYIYFSLLAAKPMTSSDHDLLLEDPDCSTVILLETTFRQSVQEYSHGSYCQRYFLTSQLKDCSIIPTPGLSYLQVPPADTSNSLVIPMCIGYSHSILV